MDELWQALIMTLLAVALWAITTHQLLRVDEAVERIDAAREAVAESLERARDPGG